MWSVHRCSRRARHAEATLRACFRLYLLTTLISMASVQAADLKPEIVEQFNDYIRQVEARLAPLFQGERFLWSDQRPKAREQVAAGQIAVEAAKNKGLIEISGGMIQDWQGAVSSRAPSELWRTT